MAVTSTQPKMTELVKANAPATEIVDLFPKKINTAAKNLELASLSLRSCYTVNAADVSSFRDLRKSVTNEALVYKIKLLPLSQAVVENMKKFFENYTALSQTEFLECIDDIAKEAADHQQQALYVAEIHRVLLVNLKKTEDKAKVVKDTLVLEQQNFAKKAKQFQDNAETKKTWATALLFIPTVGIIASHIVGKYAADDITQASANQKNADLAVAAANCIEQVLMVAIQRFIEAMTAIAGFFSVLESDVRSFAQGASSVDKERPKIHYLKLKSKSNDVIQSCNDFIAVVPSSKANLEAIPTTDTDKNYVAKWLENQKRKENPNQSLLEWGKTIFKSKATLTYFDAIQNAQPE